MAKGAGIPKRRAIMNSLEQSDPALFEELMWLRKYTPNAYRRRMNAMMATLDELPDLGEYEALQRREAVAEVAAPRLVLPEERPQAGERSTAAEEALIDQEGTSADFSVLKLSIKGLREALATGEHDPFLGALLEAEEQGRSRAGAIKAMKARIKVAG